MGVRACRSETKTAAGLALAARDKPGSISSILVQAAAAVTTAALPALFL